MRTKALILIFLFLSFTSTAFAQKGLYLRFSLGPGYNIESHGINKSGLTLPTKNHALGWGLNDKYALFITDFGGLLKQDVGDYSYINLDALGLGFTYHFNSQISLSLAVAQGTVSFAKSWKEATGDEMGKGMGINLFLDRTWSLSKRWNVGLSPQFFLIRTCHECYQFMNFSVNGFVQFYPFPSHE